MRYATFLPRRRPMFGRRADPIEPAPAVQPTREERRLLDRIITHMKRRGEG